MVALLLVAGVIAARVPAGTWSQIRHAADSASVEAAKQPPSEWIRRVAPASRYSAASATPSGLNAAMAAWGLMMGFGMLGTMFGTAGWAGTALLVFYRSGFWFRQVPRVETDPDIA